MRLITFPFPLILYAEERAVGSAAVLADGSPFVIVKFALRMDIEGACQRSGLL